MNFKLITRTIQSARLQTIRQFSGVSEKPLLVPIAEVKRFITQCMESLQTPKGHAVQLAEVLVAADYSGHYSHGLNRLELYIKDVSSGICDGGALPEVIKETVATGFVDGKNSLGPVVGNYSMNLAIEKAKAVGVGWVVATRSNHYGIAGWYSRQAMEQDLIGMSFTNTSPFLSPTRSKSAALGTNPIRVAARGTGDSNTFVLDMATTAVAVGKIELQKRKGEPIPAGWAQDFAGNITNDPNEAMAASCLMPLGGSEVNSGYKGYGLALMVELFCGILGGGAVGPKIRKWMTASTEANLGQAFVAIDPSCFALGFKDRLSELIQHLRSMEPSDPTKPVLVAGDPEKEHRLKVDQQRGIYYHRNQIEAASRIGKRCGVEPPRAIMK